MIEKIFMNLLGCYNLILAYGAIREGIRMLVKSGIYVEYPKGWLVQFGMKKE